MRKLTFLLIVLASTSAYATDFFPRPGWRDEPNPFASLDAQVGGQISLYLAQYPKSLNYYLDISFQASQIFTTLYETLLTMHPATLAYEPGIAEKWSISDDKKTFTFYIDKKARWSDGRPITAQDIKWTYDMIMDQIGRAHV